MTHAQNTTSHTFHTHPPYCLLINLFHSPVLRRVPPAMLLLFKTNDCLRHVERQLHAAADSLLITLKFCLRVLLAHKEAGAAVRLGGHNVASTTLARRTLERLRAKMYWLRLHVAYWLLGYVTRPDCEQGVAARALRKLLGATV